MTSPAPPQEVGGLPARFTKMCGAGNDFIVFGTAVEVGPREAGTIRRACRRGTGVGADGVLFVVARGTDRGRPRFLADYFNSDGGRARFCANGTRCAARFAARATGATELLVETGWGEIPATLLPDGEVKLQLPEPVAGGAEVGTFETGGRLLEPTGVALSVGVPHLVVFTAEGVDLEALDVAALGPPLRHHPELPEGANVSFVSRRGASRLSARAFERGVEGETLSCGSGVVAAAVVAALRRGERPPLSVATRSGILLTVDFRTEGGVAREVTLTGDARFVFEGTLAEEGVLPGPLEER